jgi:hypothetical protein
MTTAAKTGIFLIGVLAIMHFFSMKDLLLFYVILFVACFIFVEELGFFGVIEQFDPNMSDRSRSGIRPIEQGDYFDWGSNGRRENVVRDNLSNSFNRDEISNRSIPFDKDETRNRSIPFNSDCFEACAKRCNKYNPRRRISPVSYSKKVFDVSSYENNNDIGYYNESNYYRGLLAVGN